MEELDGNTGKPDSFTRPIKKHLANVVNLVVVKYKTVPASDNDFDENEICTNQKYSALAQSHKKWRNVKAFGFQKSRYDEQFKTVHNRK